MLNIAQCGNLGLFLSLRFYVKSIMGNLEVENMYTILAIL